MKQTEIEQLENSGQISFWKEIEKIGIAQKRNKNIRFEVKLANGDISSTPEDVMQVWKTSFENLLNRNDDNINLTQEQHSNV